MHLRHIGSINLATLSLFCAARPRTILQRTYYDSTGYEDSAAAAAAGCASHSQYYAEDLEEIFNMFFG